MLPRIEFYSPIKTMKNNISLSEKKNKKKKNFMQSEFSN